jgi:hypothetical protein
MGLARVASNSGELVSVVPAFRPSARRVSLSLPNLNAGGRVSKTFPGPGDSNRAFIRLKSYPPVLYTCGQWR